MTDQDDASYRSDAFDEHLYNAVAMMRWSLVNRFLRHE